MTPYVRNRARELARAATLLEAGERLAVHAASAQAAIAPEPRAARFFALQARQEAFHARVFAATATFLAPGPGVAHPGAAALAAYRARLAADLDAGDLWSSVVGVQVVLEALGVAVLGEVEGAPRPPSAGARAAPAGARAARGRASRVRGGGGPARSRER
jgi:hypothetical protein